ncbi:MAG: hypothetical protein JNL03_07235 [Prolixibacteraceae bacterium]|nr:hypothetical protein [Prolixibacteraceae bacterium]
MENQNTANEPKKKTMSDMVALAIGVVVLIGVLILLKYGMKALNLI